jgi:capsule polysaccharide export protein KpsE/RkpR
MLETKSQLAEKDVNQAVERLEGEQSKNSEFRIKWPRGELGSPPADSEQFMLIEHIAGQVEKIQNRLEDMMNNGVNITRLQQDVKDLSDDVEKLKDGQRSLKANNGGH